MKPQREVAPENSLKPGSHGAEPASPCVHVCEMDDNRGLCRGCARTRDEIANWTNCAGAEKLAVLQRVALRKALIDMEIPPRHPTHRS